MELVYKRRGETPLQALDALRAAKPEYEKLPLSYAGRLDPMAEGAMLVLVGEENKNREKYLGLDKEYEVDVLFGIETDTYDCWGKIVGVKDAEFKNFNLEKYTGTFSQQYPPYSSQPVQGKPLFEWAREGRLSEIVIPIKQVEIYSIELLSERSITGAELLESAQRDSELIQGNFRQEEILASWKHALAEHKNHKFLAIKIKVTCSSGTYMRSLAHALGKERGVGAIAYRIMRTKVGNFTV